MRVSMKHNIIRYTMIVLLIGSVALTAGRAYAQGGNHRYFIADSFSFGIERETVRVSVVNVAFADTSVRTNDPVVTRIQLLDTEGEVIAQSDEIRIEPGKTRFWDVSRDQIRAEGDPGTGRLQVRIRILVTTRSSDADCERPPLAPTTELINPSTGETTDFILWREMLTRVPPT